MPIYEYECAKCKKVHEVWQSITENSGAKCPDCKAKMQRLISASGFALKGSGWYKTDYERKPKASEKSDKGDKKEKKDTGESKSDGPSEKPAETKSDKPDNKSQAA